MPKLNISFPGACVLIIVLGFVVHENTWAGKRSSISQRHSMEAASAQSDQVPQNVDCRTVLQTAVDTALDREISEADVLTVKDLGLDDPEVQKLLFSEALRHLAQKWDELQTLRSQSWEIQERGRRQQKQLELDHESEMTLRRLTRAAAALADGVTSIEDPFASAAYARLIALASSSERTPNQRLSEIVSSFATKVGANLTASARPTGSPLTRDQAPVAGNKQKEFWARLQLWLAQNESRGIPEETALRTLPEPWTTLVVPFLVKGLATFSEVNLFAYDAPIVWALWHLDQAEDQDDSFVQALFRTPNAEGLAILAKKVWARGSERLKRLQKKSWPSLGLNLASRQAVWSLLSTEARRAFEGGSEYKVQLRQQQGLRDLQPAEQGVPHDTDHGIVISDRDEMGLETLSRRVCYDEGRDLALDFLRNGENHKVSSASVLQILSALQPYADRRATTTLRQLLFRTWQTSLRLQGDGRARSGVNSSPPLSKLESLTALTLIRTKYRTGLPLPRLLTTPQLSVRGGPSQEPPIAPPSSRFRRTNSSAVMPVNEQKALEALENRGR